MEQMPNLPHRHQGTDLNLSRAGFLVSPASQTRAQSTGLRISLAQPPFAPLLISQFISSPSSKQEPLDEHSRLNTRKYLSLFKLAYLGATKKKRRRGRVSWRYFIQRHVSLEGPNWLGCLSSHRWKIPSHKTNNCAWRYFFFIIVCAHHAELFFFFFKKKKSWRGPTFYDLRAPLMGPSDFSYSIRLMRPRARARFSIIFWCI